MKTHSMALLILLMGLLGLGCNDKEERYFGCPPRGGILVYMDSDTVLFMPGDSASCDGWVVVTDWSGYVLPNVEVRITLLEPFGSIELLKGTDSTNEEGRVYFRFRAYNQTGVTTIRAAVGNRVDLWSLTVLPLPIALESFSLHLSRDTLWVAPMAEDSVEIIVTGVGRTDSTMGGVHGITLPVRADGGRLRPIGPTDSSGSASTWWLSNGEYGTFHIWTALDTFFVLDSVVVLPIAPAEGRSEP